MPEPSFGLRKKGADALSKFERLVGAAVRSDDGLAKVASCDQEFLSEFGFSEQEVAMLQSGEIADLVAGGATAVTAVWLSMLRHPEFADVMSAAEYLEELGVS